MCSLTMECVLLLRNVFSYSYRMCSLTTEYVLLLLQNAFSYYRMCSPGSDVRTEDAPAVKDTKMALLTLAVTTCRGEFASEVPEHIL